MTGTQVRLIRAALRLTRAGLSTVVGVAPEIVEGWEGFHGDEAPLDRFQLRVLELAQFTMRNLKRAQAIRFRNEFHFDLSTGGGPFALYRLLDFAFKRQTYSKRIIESRYRRASGKDKGAPGRPYT